MLLRVSLTFLRCRGLSQTVQRNIASSSTLNMDPVQQVFLDQIKKYRVLSEKQGGAVDAGPEFQKTKKDAIDRIAKLYDVQNPTQFPDFQFQAPDLDQDETEFTKE